MATATVTAMAIPAAKSGTDKLPSGTWSFGPIGVQWSIESNNEVDVAVSVLGINVDTLTGTLNSANPGLKDTLNILGIVTGTLGINAVFGQGSSKDGLWISGDVRALGWDPGAFDQRVIPW